MPTLPHRRNLTGIERAWLAVAMLVFVVVIGTIGFMLLEKRSLADAFYMTLATISTLGLKPEASPDVTGLGKIWIAFLIVTGIGTAMVAVSLIVSVIVEGQVRRILGRSKVNRKIASLSDHFVVCGFGRTGSSVCANLRIQGAGLVVIDKDDSCTALAEQEGFPYVLGDASDESVLLSAGVKRARGLVALLPTDADNVLVSLVARDLREDIFIAVSAERVDSEAHLRRAGANSVICPQLIGAKRLANILTRPGVVDFIDFAAEGLDLEAEQFHIKVDSKLVGLSLREANLPREIGVLVIALKRSDGQIVFNPDPDAVFRAGDAIIVTGQIGSMKSLESRYS